MLMLMLILGDRHDAKLRIKTIAQSWNIACILNYLSLQYSTRELRFNALVSPGDTARPQRAIHLKLG
jgi:hypothetical protein